MHIHVLARGQHRAADDARAADAQHQAEHTNNLEHARPDHRDHGDQDHQLGERHVSVNDTLHDHVEAPTQVPGKRADQHRDHGGQRGGRQADDDRQLRAVQAAREHVAAQVVGAEWMFPGRRVKPLQHADLVEAIRRQQLGKYAAKHEQQEHRRRCCTQRFLAQQSGKKLVH